MKQKLRSVMVLLSVALIGALPSVAAEASASGNSRFPELDRARISTHPETGKVRFIGTRPGRQIARPSAVAAGARPVDAARSYMQRYASLFGIRSASADLDVQRTLVAGRGGSVVRFQQVHEGVPVMAGELSVQLDRDNDLLSASGEVLPTPQIDTQPTISRRDAAAVARGAVARGKDMAGGRLHVSAPELWVYDASLLGGPGPEEPKLVWRMEVTAEPTDAVRELVLVDAQRGGVTLTIDQIAEAKDRKICNNNNDSTKDYPCVGSYARVEGQAPTAIADVNNAYDFSGHTYDFFFNRFGRDSLDGAGMPLRSTVKYCDPTAPCPFQNAFWEGTQMVYGDGFASADDVVGHELAHGFTDHTSHLYYYYQSGAINESLSDVFGELIDLTNLVGTDDAASRWKLGEDLPASIGVIRDMEDPTVFGDPDRMRSPNYWSNAGDSGGVHANSGVNNKATYLMVDGGTFNSTTVAGIGIDKTARIYYDASVNLLTSGSDYGDLYDYLQQACSAAIGGSESITLSDCAEVKKALDATEMNLQPVTGVAATDAPVCDDPAQTPTDMFFDDVESATNTKWSKTGTANVWFAPQTTYPAGSWDPSFAHSGTRNIYGDDFQNFLDGSLQMTNPVAVPVGAYMHFAHAYGFDDVSGTNYDGGVVEYSADGGAWTDAGSLFTHNGYDGVLPLGYGNPLGGRNAFGGDSYGYISSRLDLSSLAGKDVRFRFRMGTDSGLYDYGWYIDDVRIYLCDGDVTAPSSVSVGGAALNKPIQLGKAFGVSWSGTDDLTGVASYDLRYRKGSAAGGIGTAYTSWKNGVSTTSASFTGAPGYAYCFSARARDHAGNVSGWSADRCTSIAANNTQMGHKGSWAKKKGTGYYLNTFSESSKKGSSMSLKVKAKRLALVATKCRGCGTVKVFLGTKLLKKVSLASTKTLKKQLISIAGFSSLRSGTVKVVVFSAGKAVRIEGFGVAKS